MILGPALHDTVGFRLARGAQRYTGQRRMLIETLAAAGRPLAVPEIVAAVPGLSQSSAYRNLTVLTDAGVVARVAGSDDHGRYELAQDLAGHHHHLVCASCGAVEDLGASERLERVLGEAAREAAAEQGYEVIEHRLDLLGRCARCRMLARG